MHLITIGEAMIAAFARNADGHSESRPRRCMHGEEDASGHPQQTARRSLPFQG
jgi:hypothetical protein